MLDARAVGHSQEELSKALVVDLLLGPIDEEAMYVMAGNGTGDGVDMGAAATHSHPFRTAPPHHHNGYAVFEVRGNKRPFEARLFA
jgi:hypothetical protein